MRRFKLLKDLPDYKAGEIFTWDEDAHIYAASNADQFGQVGKWPARFVENNDYWFQEILPEPESPFTISQIVSKQAGPELYCTSIFSNKEIPTDRQEELSKIIEDFITTNESYTKIKEGYYRFISQNLYTEEEAEKFFNAGRRGATSFNLSNVYSTSSDYIKTLKP